MTLPAIDETRLLHAGGPDRRWGNLGLWPDDGSHVATPYATAAEALARRVAVAAGLRAGDRVLGIACGAGEELELWVDGFGAAAAVGLDHDLRRVQQAADRATERATARALQRGRITLLGGSVDSLPRPGPGFDRVLCVDAAYHFSPRAQFFEAAWAQLRPGGTFAWTDLVVGESAAEPRWRRPSGLEAVARRAGIDLDELAPVATTITRLERLGASSVGAERLDDAVLAGFVRFVGRQSRSLGWRALHPAWWRVAATAALIPWLRRAGLGYALFTASRPPSPTPAASGDGT
jgi:SAM-dependent methyltransferase